MSIIIFICGVLVGILIAVLSKKDTLKKSAESFNNLDAFFIIIGVTILLSLFLSTPTSFSANLIGLIAAQFGWSIADKVTYFIILGIPVLGVILSKIYYKRKDSKKSYKWLEISIIVFYLFAAVFTAANFFYDNTVASSAMLCLLSIFICLDTAINSYYTNKH